MPCYHPLEGYRSRETSSNGKRKIVFNVSDGYADLPVKLPCGQCIGCRLERSRQWAVRCVHEASLHEHNSFITLTFNNEHLPSDGSLEVKTFQKFMKRLRKKYSPKIIRFFHCGEYGEKFQRPHYHACLFGHDFKDKTLWRTMNDNKLYISQELSTLWPYGFSTIGDVTFESAAYVARYITKKVNGKDAAEHYQKLNLATGEIHTLKPEYTTMSRRPGLAKKWFEKYQNEVYPSDEIVLRGKLFKPPKYYDYLYEHSNPIDLSKLKGIRIAKSKLHSENQTVDRLLTRELCHKKRAERLKRSYENEN